jgi:hypothetical protein
LDVGLDVGAIGATVGEVGFDVGVLVGFVLLTAALEGDVEGDRVGTFVLGALVGLEGLEVGPCAWTNAAKTITVQIQITVCGRKF